MNIAETLLQALKDNGVGEIFGIPGDFVLSFFKVIEESNLLPLYTLSHEPGVGFAADAAARYKSAPSAACVTYGAGALNMVNPVASAYAEKSPVVVISGGPGAGESHIGLLLHHQAKTLDSQFQIYKEVTCDQVKLDDPGRAPEDIARALCNCRLHSRPVYIELPRDMVFEPCRPVTPMHPAPPDPEALEACVDEIMERLNKARSPVLMAGVEIRRYNLETKVAAMARKLGLPVVTGFMGRGLLADIDAPLLGTYLGMAGDPEITRLVENSDTLMLLGFILSDTNLGVSEKQINLRKSIQIFDGKVIIGYHIYPHIPLNALVDALLERLKDRSDVAPASKPVYPCGLEADEQSITPLDIARAVNDLMKRVGRMPMATDMGDCMFTAFDIENTDLVAPGYYATMGFGVPAGMGLQAATGRRTLILVGDGAFRMTGWELGNCSRYGWDPVVLLFNNCSWEMLRAFQPESGFNDLGDWNFAAMADGLGGDGVRVRTRRELSEALSRAASVRGRFQLIEIMIPKGVLSKAMTCYTRGLKRMRARNL